MRRLALLTLVASGCWAPGMSADEISRNNKWIFDGLGSVLVGAGVVIAVALLAVAVLIGLFVRMLVRMFSAPNDVVVPDLEGVVGTTCTVCNDIVGDASTAAPCVSCRATVHYDCADRHRHGT